MRKVPTNQAEPRLAGLVLAAGGARRFGSAKQLLPWQGEPLVVRSARLAAECCGAGVTVVTGGHGERVQEVLAQYDLGFVDNPDWESGLSSSLRCGFAAVPPEASAVLVLLADQPLIPAGHYRALLGSWRSRPDTPVATAYGERAGVPAILPVSLIPDIDMSAGDRGAAAWLSARPDCVRVACDDAQRDVDTPEDWAQLTRSRLQ